MQPYDLICLGCGPAGEKAATQAAYFGLRVAVVERNARPGGAMVNTGTVPSKALRETALLCSAFHRRPLPGTEFAIDHNVSVPKFMARRHLIEQQEHDRIEFSMDRHGIDVYRGRGRIVDPQTVSVTAEDGAATLLRARYILIATGSSPVRPDHVPFDHPSVVDADGVLKLDHLPSSMIIVGGGVIGTEYASIFAEIDVRITLVHTGESVLPFLDKECREHLLRSMRDRGVEFVMPAEVDRISPRNTETIEVHLKDGRQFESEALLWAAGRSSNTADLGLDEVGVTMGRRGLILVDESYRTNIPSIYAVGDVIGFPALASTSMEQGRIAVCSMFDLNFKQKLAAVTPMCIYAIPAISSVGMTAAEAVQQQREIVIGRAEYRMNVRGRMLGDEDGLLKCVFDRRTRALLGATIIGEDATELIHLAQCAIANGTGIDYFIDACFNYPSLSELYKYAAYSALQAMASDDASARAA